MIIPNIWDFSMRVLNFLNAFVEQAYNFLFYEFRIYLPVFNGYVDVNILELMTIYLIFILIARLIDKLPIA